MTTKTKKPAFVQLRANKLNEDHIEPAQHQDEVEFYSIYLGEPGNYQWVADFECHTDALYAVHRMVEAFGCEVDRSQYDAARYTPAPVPQTKGHPHAALMAEYAKDAAETDKPWERWEVSLGPGQPWVTCIAGPNWQVTYSFRRKPEPTKTIMINAPEQPARKPLTRADYEDKSDYLGCTSVAMRHGFEAGVRFAERMHGIGG